MLTIMPILFLVTFILFIITAFIVYSALRSSGRWFAISLFCTVAIKISILILKVNLLWCRCQNWFRAFELYRQWSKFRSLCHCNVTNNIWLLFEQMFENWPQQEGQLKTTLRFDRLLFSSFLSQMGNNFWFKIWISLTESWGGEDSVLKHSK